jgi:Sulfotransferase domain
MDPSLSRPLIHIGYHKTGTSWFQKNLFDTKENGFSPLVSNRVSKDDKGLFECQRFARNFIFGLEGNLLGSDEFSADSVRELLADCKPIDSGIPVISHERLSGNPHAGGFDSEKICSRLSQVFDSPKIFMMLREQKSLILSCYFQYLGMGGTLSIQDYVNQPDDERLPKFNKSFFQFNHLISRYQKAFGKDHVLVLPYEMFRDDPHQMLEKLKSFTGAVVPDSLPFAQKVNSRLNAFLGARLRFLNCFTRRDSLNGYSPFFMGKFFQKLDRSLRKRMGGIVPDFIENAEIAKHKRIIQNLVGDFYEASNRETEELTGLELKPYDYK